MDRLGKLGQHRRLWDAVTGESCAILPHPGSVRALAFSPDSSWLVSGCDLDESLQHLERRDRPAREKVQGARKRLLFRQSR